MLASTEVQSHLDIFAFQQTRHLEAIAIIIAYFNPMHWALEHSLVISDVALEGSL